MITKIILSVILILFLIVFVSATKLGISPAKIEIKGETGNKICKNVYLFSDYDGYLIGKTKWAKSGGKDFRNYNLDAENLYMGVEYPRRINVSDKKEIEICLIAEKPGDYYGALVYSTENGSAGIGTWIYANILGEEIEQEKVISLTGKVINNSGKNLDNSLNIKLMSILSTINLSLFLFLLVVSKRG